MAFDVLSFALGFVTASAIVALLYRFRGALRNLRDQLRQNFDDFRQRLTSSTDERYRQDVTALWQRAHLAGSILPLTDIAIAPRFWQDLPLNDATEDPEVDITYVIPATPDYPELAALYHAPAHSLRDLCQSPHDYLILGKPGAGKSVALYLIGLQAAANNADFFATPKTPVLVHAGDLELPLAEKADVAQPLLDAAAAPLSAITAPAFPRFCKALLSRSETLILLDGIDDLPPQQMSLVVEWIRSLRAAYPNNRLIATAPLPGYAPLLSLGFVPAFIGGWSGDDYQTLVNKWVEAWPNVPGAQRRRRRSDETVDPALVAGWLTGGSSGRLPFDISLKVWTGLAGDAEGSRTVDWVETYTRRMARAPEARLALMRAAGEALSRDRYGMPRERLATLINSARGEVSNPSTMDPQDVVDELAGKGGLLVRRAGGRYSLSHPLVSGYLAATYITPNDSPDAILAVHQQPLWHTALRFYATLSNANPIAGPRLTSMPDVLQTDLLTVAGWLADAPADAPWRAEVFRRLAQLFVNASVPADLRARITCAMVASRDDNVAKFFKQALVSPDPAARQYAAAALGALGDSSAVTPLAKLLEDNDLYVRWAAVLALALIGDTAALETLGKALLEGDEQLKRAVCEALAIHPAEGHPILRDAITFDDVVVRRYAVAGLKRIGNQPWVLALLEKAFMEDTQWIVRSAAEAALEELRAAARPAPQPVPPPTAMGWLHGFAVSKGESVPAGDGGKALMIVALQEGDDRVRIAAADYLGRTATTSAVGALATVARGGAPAPREAALRAMAYIAIATGQRTTL